MNNTPTTHTQNIGMRISSVVSYLGNMYSSGCEAFAQAVENGTDANAQRIWCIFEPERILVTDDGHGMIPYMLPDDYEALQDHIASEKESYDIRSKLHSVSLTSYQYMMLRIGHSQKIFGHRHTKGIRGIGALAWMQYGGQVRMLTKPSEALRLDASLDHSVWELIPPNISDFEKGNTAYTIKKSKEELKSPWGTALASGTMVEVNDINWDSLRSIGNIVEYLTQRFADALQRGVNITIIDKYSREGRATAGGKEIHLKPVQYKGISIYDKTLHIDSKDWPNMPFRISLYYRPARGHDHTVNDRITVLRRGGAAFTLTDMPEFKKDDVWRKVQGKIEYPLPDVDEHDQAALRKAQAWDSKQWMPSKQGLLDTTEKSLWVKKIKTIEKYLEEAIAQEERKYKERQRKQRAAGLGELVMQAVESLPAFQALMVPAYKKRLNQEKERKIRTTIQAKVSNEHNQGIPNILIKLRPPDGKSTVTLRTNSYGMVDFGQHSIGQYVMTIDVPAEMSLVTRGERDDHRYFEVTKDEPGTIEYFRLKTGSPEPKREKRMPHKLEVGFDTLSNALIPWEQRLEYGQIIINDAAAPLCHWLGTNEPRAEQLILNHCAAAVAEYCIEGDKNFVLVQQSIILGRMLEIMQTSRKRKKKTM